MTLNWGLFKTRSNSLSTSGWGESKQTVSFELVRFVATVRQGRKNWPEGQGGLGGVFSNCYWRLGCIPQGGDWKAASEGGPTTASIAGKGRKPDSILWEKPRKLGAYLEKAPTGNPEGTL
jgi:hypothetical protein